VLSNTQKKERNSVKSLSNCLASIKPSILSMRAQMKMDRISVKNVFFRQNDLEMEKKKEKRDCSFIQ